VILFDFVKMNLSFKKEGRMIELKGISDEVKLLMMSVRFPRTLQTRFVYFELKFS